MVIIHPMPTPPAWSAPFHEAANLGYKVSIIDHTGACLAVANWGGELTEHWPAIRGHRWHEYVSPQDLPRLLRWFQPDGADLPPILYGGLGRCSGIDQPVLIALVKVAVPGGVWLVVWNQRPAGRQR